MGDLLGTGNPSQLPHPRPFQGIFNYVKFTKKRTTQPFAQDGVDRDFWKFGSLLLCHDKSELNCDKFLLFDHFSTSKKGERDALKQELQRWKIVVTKNIFSAAG